MIVPDTNLLIYTYDRSSPHHVKAKDWWESVLSGREPVGIPWIVVLAFVRIMTHPVVCTRPLGVLQVRNEVEYWCDFPHIRMLVPSEETMQIFFYLLEEADMGGNLSTDALIAAHAIEHAAIVYSNDRDFGRFKQLRTRNPLL